MPATVWKGGRGQLKIIVLKVMSHTFETNHHRPLLGNWNVLILTRKELESLEGAEISSRYCWSFFYSGADPSMSAQVSVEILTSPE